MVKLLSCALLTNFRISGTHLFDDELHLLESDMSILAKTCISRLNYFYGHVYTIQAYAGNQRYCYI